MAAVPKRLRMVQSDVSGTTRCCDIRRGECQQELQDDWEFCPSCGGVLGYFEVSEEYPIAVVAGEPCQWICRPRVRGWQQIAVEIDVEDGAAIATLQTSSFVGKGNCEFAVGFAALEPDAEYVVPVRVRTYDGERLREALWIPRPVRESRIQLRVRAVPPPSLTIRPEVIVLAPGRASRGFELLNPSDLPVKVRRVEVPKGFRLASKLEPGLQINPGDVVEARLEAMGTPPVDFRQLRVLLEEPAEEAVARVVVLPAPSVEHVDRFVVGVDFGTSNTSVVIRDTQTNLTRFLTDPERLPSVVACPSASPGGWLYGLEAVRAIRNRDARDAFSDMKRQLRDTGHPPVHSGTNLLVWYFGRLREDLVLPYLKDVAGESRVGIRMVFSLPVLDGPGGPAFERQKEATLAAARDAGFSELGDIEWAFEPACAALCLLLSSRVLDGRGWSDGDRFAIFDSGGGTTDIAVGRLRLLEGRLRVEDIKVLSASLTLTEGQQEEFGGDDITRYLARDAIPEPKALEARLLAENHLESMGDDRWWKAFPNNYYDVEERKQTVANLLDFDEEVVWLPENRSLGLPQVTVCRRQIKSCVDKAVKLGLLDSLRREFDQAQSEGDPIRYLFAVGGNSVTPDLVDALGAHFNGAAIKIPRDERLTAVPQGTVWTYRPEVDTVPYEVSVMHDNRVLFRVSPRQRLAIQSATDDFIVHPGQTFVAKVAAQVDGNSGLLGRIAIRNDDCEVKRLHLRYKIEYERIIVEYRWAGQSSWTEVLSYEF